MLCWCISAGGPWMHTAVMSMLQQPELEGRMMRPHVHTDCMRGAGLVAGPDLCGAGHDAGAGGLEQPSGARSQRAWSGEGAITLIQKRDMLMCCST